jgi:hypothetical protein
MHDKKKACLKLYYTCTKLHGTTAQETNLDSHRHDNLYPKFTGACKRLIL